MKKKPEELEPIEKKDKKSDKDKKPRANKKVEYEGSRWSSLILLLITILASLFFLVTSGR